MPTINVSEELYRYFGQFAHKDESWSDALARVRAHLDQESALEDRRNRQTTYDSTNSTDRSSGDTVLGSVANGTPVRHAFQRGEYAGEVVRAEIRDGRVAYDGEEYASSPAARKADTDLRGGDADYSHNGWQWWEYYDDASDEWRTLDTLRS